MRARAVVICTIAVGVATLAVFGGASAQQENPTTPGAIPNPGSYQGSTELQRQQDQQDQQFRQQQQTPSPNWGAQAGSRAYGPGSQRPGGGAPMPSSPCFGQVAAIHSLQPLAANVTVGPVDPSATYLFNIGSRPTASEQVLLRRWLSARRNCRITAYARPEAQTPKFRFMDARWGALATEQLIERLISGELTYGQFNRQRAENSITSARWWSSH